MSENALNNLESEVKNIISAMTGLKPENIASHVHMYNDLGIDSIKAIELVVAIQEKFGIRVSDAKIPQLTTVKLVAGEIGELLAKKG